MSNKLSLLVSFIGADKLSGSIRNITGASKKGSIALKAMGDESRRLKRELADVGRQLQSATGNVTGLMNRERDLARQLEFSNRQIEQQKNRLRDLAAIERTTADRKAMASNLVSSGQSDIAQGLSLAAPLILATKAAADFTTGMVDIQQKADLSDAATARLQNTIVKAAQASRQLPENMRAAVDVLAGKGLDPRQAVLLAPSIGRLGTAFRVDLADGAAAAYANLNNLKVPISQTSAALDVMAASGNMGAFEIRDMARHFPALTAQMQALGAKGVPAVGQLSAALQVAEKGTGNADQAANNVQNLLSKINAPGTVKAFEKNFGIDLPAAMKKLEAQGYDTVESIAMITSKATGGDLKKLGYAFEDMQAQGALRSLIQNLDEYRTIRDKSLKSTGVIDKAFDQRVLKDANVSWEAFKGTASTLAITLGTTLLPVMTEALAQIGGLAMSVSNWAQANPEAAATIIKLVAGLAVFKLGLGAAKIALGGIIGPFATAWGWFQKMRTLGVLSKGLWLLRSGAWIAGKAIMFLGRAILMNPIGLLVAGLAVAAYLIYTHWDTIKAAFWAAVAWLGQAWTAIKTRFMEGVTFIIGLHGKMLGYGKNIVQGLVDGILSAPGAVWNALKRIVGFGIDQVKSFLGIKSPSRLFMALGGHVSSGMALGIDGGRQQAIQSAQRLASGVAGAGMPQLVRAGQPIRSSSGNGAGAAAAAAALTLYLTINALPGQDVNELAELVIKKIEQLMGVRRRSSYEDD
jgi:TP901 family phage tail tape measure protein